MEDLTWAVRCANVGIKGGALLLVATVVLFAAGLGADGFLFTIAAHVKSSITYLSLSPNP